MGEQNLQLLKFKLGGNCKMKKSIQFTVLGFTSALFITSCSSVDTFRTAYTAYEHYKGTKEAVKGYENLKSAGSIVKLKPVFLPYKYVKVEVKLSNVKNRNNKEVAKALKENIEYGLNNYFKNYGLEDKKICETSCGEPLIIINFKEKKYKSLLQKWALKGKYGGTIQYIDGKTGKVILEDKFGNEETFYDLAKDINRALELKVFKSGYARYQKDVKKAEEYANQHNKYMKNRDESKFVNPKFKKILRNT